ncbi:MAG: ROK family protein, partial [Clostridiales bacterium]|nr:ROK family protein [Clostridiales bacterium]
MNRIDQTSIRRQNLQRLADVLVAHQPITRQELARRAELSLMSVTNLVEQLSAHGALTFSDQPNRPTRGRVGRRAEYLSLNADANGWLIVDLMNMRFRHVVMGIDGSTRELGRPWPYEGSIGYQANLSRYLGEVAGELAAGRGFRALGAAVVVPGPYDPDADAIINTRIPELNGVRIKAALREHLGDCPCYVDEDVKLAARASLSRLRGDPPEVMFYLYIGEGVSGAIVYEGRVVRGLSAMAGEAGQIASSDGRTYEERLSKRAFAGALARQLGEPADEVADRLGEIRMARPAAYAEALLALAPALAELMSRLC